MDTDGYLARLGMDRPPAPTLDWLFAAHHAQMERVPYSTIDIHLGRPGSLDPAVCVDRIARTGRTVVNQTLRRVEGARTADTPLSSPAEFFDVLADVFGLGLEDLDAEDRALLWREAQVGQAAYEASLASVASLESRHVAG